jgi:sugar phosphate isomerase/epimerase
LYYLAESRFSVSSSTVLKRLYDINAVYNYFERGINMSYDKIIRSMKVGFMGPFYPVPADVSDGDRVEWLFKRAHEIGCTTMDYAFRFDDSDESTAKLKGLMETYDIEPDMRTPRNLFSLAGGDADAGQAKKDLILRCKTMHKLGLHILRAGYGKNTIPSSRFSRDIDVEAHKQKLIDNLRAAAEILEDEGIYFALENHCDFTAQEFVEIFEAVDSPNVGCALDTGNGIIVFSDPNVEYKLLAPYVITTHIKDMDIIADPEKDHVPFMSCNALMGEGIVDIEDAIETCARRSKHAEGLHLIVETGTGGWAPQFSHMTDEERTALCKTWFDTYIEKLLKFIDR